MNKAEEKAKSYCKEKGYKSEWIKPYLAYIEGYKQAEKDLELTWHDIQRIVKIADQIVDENRGKFMAMEDEDYYKEVLARYVKQSEKP